MLDALVTFATIFLYKNRMLQIRMSIFNNLLLVGYYIALHCFLFCIEERCQSVCGLGALLTIGVYRSECAIIRAGRDEVMVKAADELR